MGITEEELRNEVGLELNFATETEFEIFDREEILDSIIENCIYGKEVEKETVENVKEFFLGK